MGGRVSKVKRIGYSSRALANPRMILFALLMFAHLCPTAFNLPVFHSLHMVYIFKISFLNENALIFVYFTVKYSLLLCVLRDMSVSSSSRTAQQGLFYLLVALAA